MTDGTVTPCVLGRFLPVGNAKSEGLAAVFGGQKWEGHRRQHPTGQRYGLPAGRLQRLQPGEHRSRRRHKVLVDVDARDLLRASPGPFPAGTTGSSPPCPYAPSRCRGFRHCARAAGWSQPSLGPG
ncbi:hypothetical protein ABT288_34030 [Streptomyces sp. NPDC001093]|uniref:hypothetical protein n=1 Tax=Streptomyces sp. NPDC001093 TaxID=3154376 RepID=UPI0033290D4F